ncbi:MAG: haloacid dehalogenase-like hydrolase [Anaerolineales bacterium]|nr:haloacid dehalogenase-like hydrolase [Anaerolineales bacterium]
MLITSDLNGTLTTGSPILAVARWVKKNQPESYPAGFILGPFTSYMQVKLGLKKIDTWGDVNMRRVLKLISEPTQEVLNHVMDSVVDDELWLKKRTEAVELLKDYHQRGAKIILISAAYEPAVQKFAAKIGAENTYGIGTPVVLTDSGIELAKILTSREVKLERLRAMIGTQQIDVALGDTFADIPLLDEAAEPIAVFPDKTLKQTALERGWKIID